MKTIYKENKYSIDYKNIFQTQLNLSFEAIIPKICLEHDLDSIEDFFDICEIIINLKNVPKEAMVFVLNFANSISTRKFVAFCKDAEKSHIENGKIKKGSIIPKEPTNNEK